MTDRKALDRQRLFGRSQSNVVAELSRHGSQLQQSNHYPPGDTDALVHLIGISMDKCCKPFRLFTADRRVIGERWRPAAQRVLAGRSLAGGAAPLLAPAIARRLEERERTIERWRVGHPDEDASAGSPFGGSRRFGSRLR